MPTSTRDQSSPVHPMPRLAGVRGRATQLVDLFDEDSETITIDASGNQVCTLEFAHQLVLDALVNRSTQLLVIKNLHQGYEAHEILTKAAMAFEVEHRLCFIQD